MASLDGPRAKIKRAKRHIHEFEQAVNGLVFSHSTHPQVILIEADLDPAKVQYQVGYVPEVSDDVAAIAGDAIHNLRSAFDLVMTQLVERAGNMPAHRRTPYFPYGDTRKRFEAFCTPEIEALIGKDAMDCVRATEAYPGGQGEAIWYLHHLDVEDKHRVVYGLGFNFASMTLPHYASEVFTPEVNAMFGEMMSGFFWKPADTLFPLEAGKPLFIGPPNPQNDPKFRFDVAFAEPEVIRAEPVLPCLTKYAEASEALIDAFALLF